MLFKKLFHAKQSHEKSRQHGLNTKVKIMETRQTLQDLSKQIRDSERQIFVIPSLHKKCSLALYITQELDQATKLCVGSKLGKINALMRSIRTQDLNQSHCLQPRMALRLLPERDEKHLSNAGEVIPLYKLPGDQE